VSVRVYACLRKRSGGRERERRREGKGER